MATDSGNAVVAEWVGPAGQQLFDGTILNPGVVVRGIGKDEAEGSDNWKPLGDLDSYKGAEDAPDTSGIRSDWSFGTEDGGEGTGRPLTDEQASEQKTPRKKASTPDPDPDPDPTPDTPTSEGATE